MLTTGEFKVSTTKTQAELTELHQMVFTQYRSRKPDFTQLEKLWTRIDELEDANGNL